VIGGILLGRSHSGGDRLVEGCPQGGQVQVTAYTANCLRA
jgi:hypothetical protein